jgi:hypothetical protein
VLVVPLAIQRKYEDELETILIVNNDEKKLFLGYQCYWNLNSFGQY